MTDGPSHRLAGGNMGTVVRHGDRVMRESGEWTPAVHRLLRQLNDAGIGGVPAPLGVTDDGREVLRFIEGEVPASPMPAWVWGDAALESAAQTLRRVHDATVGLSVEGPWRSPTREPADVICHNDFAPYNLVFRAGVVVGVIDWDMASPGPRLWDLAYLAYRILPLTTDDWGDGFAPAERRQRAERLMRAYGDEWPLSELTLMVRRRLLALAAFSDQAARRLGKPELSDHAVLYRHDAQNLLDW